jgi:hypothetical protein
MTSSRQQPVVQAGSISPLPSGSAPGASAAWSRAWLIFLAAGAVGIVAYLLVPEGLPRDVVYQLFGLASAAAIVVGSGSTVPAGHCRGT